MKNIINAKLKKLNDTMTEWADMFENKPKPFMNFAVTTNGQLSVNGVILAPIEMVCLDDLVWDAEMLELSLSDGSTVVIGIRWSNTDEQPSIDYIMHQKLLFQCS